MNKQSSIILGIVIVVIILIGAGWYVYSTPSLAMALGLRHSEPQMGMASTTPMRGGMMRGGFVTGSIEVLSDNGFTVTLQNGTTKDVTLMATTTLQNYAAASSTPTIISADQLSVGEPVSVIGTPEADGSIAARTVRTGVFPAMGQGRGGAGGRGRYGQASSSVPAAQ